MVDDLNPARNLSPPKKSHFWLRLYRWGIVGAVVYLSVLLLLLLLENQLVFPGSKYPRGNWQPQQFEFEEVSYQAEDGTELVSWFLDADSNAGLVDSIPEKDRCTILLFHGNAENVAQSAARMGRPLQDTLDADVLVAEYRGYGKSSGSPDEAGVLQDAEAALKWLCQKTSKSPKEIILVGHSLGGAPACYLAGKEGCRALILDRTFDSLASAAQRSYPIFPVKWLMRNTMRSDLWIKTYHGPVLVIHGDGDTLIPEDLARNLFNSATHEHKKLLILKDWGHWDAFPKHYWQDVLGFLNHTSID